MASIRSMISFTAIQRNYPRSSLGRSRCVVRLAENVSRGRLRLGGTSTASGPVGSPPGTYGKHNIDLAKRNGKRRGLNSTVSLRFLMSRPSRTTTTSFGRRRSTAEEGNRTILSPCDKGAAEKPLFNRVIVR